MKINKKGFTLVELLVVIAIIGILSTVAIVNLDSARDKAKVSNALSWGANLKPLIVLCDNDGGNLTNPMTGTPIPSYTEGGSDICTISGNGLWPDNLPGDYELVGISDQTGDGSWKFGIIDLDTGLDPVWCDNVTGCDLTF